MAEENAFAPAFVASIDTAMVRILKSGRRPFPDPTLIVVSLDNPNNRRRQQEILALGEQGMAGAHRRLRGKPPASARSTTVTAALWGVNRSLLLVT